MKTSPLIIAAAVLVMAMPAFAQGTSITLQAQGNVMVSTDGDFVTAPTGTNLEAGNRVMLADGASARVVYDNGCDVAFEEAGVYTIDANCTPAAYANSNTGTDWRSAGLITAGAVVGAALLDNMDETSEGSAPPASR